jgi:aminoglycoside/choline kinase family phosphotransferase
LLKQIVTGADQLTPDWFTTVLADAGAADGARVTDARVESVGAGLMARMVRAELSYDTYTEAPSSVVVKFPTDDQGSLGLALAMGMYELEVHFYQDIAPLLESISVPNCYLAELDDDSGMFTLVLEDLSARTRPGDVLTAASAEECAAVLAELVKFQAPLWNSDELQRLEWLTDTRRTLGVFDSLPMGLEPFIARFADKLDPEHVKLFESVMPHSGAWVRRWKAPTVVQHGDFRSDNILFGTAGDGAAPVTVIDFQTVRLGPPGLDPAYFLGSSLPTDQRRELERDLIIDYHRGLVAAGVEGFGFDACWSAYREGAMYGVFLFVGMASQVESTERGDKVIADQIKRYADMAIDLEAPAVAGLA